MIPITTMDDAHALLVIAALNAVLQTGFIGGEENGWGYGNGDYGEVDGDGDGYGCGDCGLGWGYGGGDGGNNSVSVPPRWLVQNVQAPLSA